MQLTAIVGNRDTRYSLEKIANDIVSEYEKLLTK